MRILQALQQLWEICPPGTILRLWQMGLAGSLLILLALAIRRIGRNRLPCWTLPVLWDIALVRLLVPFSIPTILNLSPLLRQPTATVVNTSPQLVFADGIAIDTVYGFTPATTVSTTPTIPIWKILWIGGTVLLGLFFLIAGFRHLRTFRTAQPVDDAYVIQWLETHPLRRTLSVRQSDQIDAPLTFGIFRPVILLPVGLDDPVQLQYVLLHEWTHIRRFDPLVKLLAIAALCLHWWNPLVWLLCRRLSRDMELACDESVTAATGQPAAYARTLLDLEARRSGVSFGSHFSDPPLKERIEAMMKRKPWSLPAKLLSLSLILGFVVTAAALSPASRDSKAPAVGAVDQGAATSSPTPIPPTEKPGTAPTTDGGTVVDRIASSVHMEEDTIRFQIPDDLPDPSKLAIHISGRAVHDDGFSQSFHYLESVHWTAGRSYDFQPDPDCTELTMSIQYGDAETTIDLLTATVMDGSDLLSYTDPADGKTYYSTDGGATFFDEAEFRERYPETNVEWWTVDEYEAWLAQEKVNLQSMLGERGWTSHDGWFTWTQEKIDESIAMYEDILRQMKNGIKFSKSVDGDTDVMLSMGTEDWAESVEATVEATVQEEIQAGWEEALAPYVPFGITCRYDAATDKTRLYWNGQEIRGIWDAERGAWISESAGIASYPKGAKELYAVYTDGKLSGLREATAAEQAEWDRTRSENTAERDRQDRQNNAFIIANSQYFPEYARYGLSYEPDYRALLYDGEIVGYFKDEYQPGTYIRSMLEGGTIGVVVQRDANNQIIGLRKTPMPSSDGSTVETGTLDNAKQDALLSEYGAHGISFDSGGNMRFDGKVVRWFIDGAEVGDGFATHYAYYNEEGTIDVHTVRNRKDNGDGSYDPFGPLTDIVAYADGELEPLEMDPSTPQVTTATGSTEDSGVSFAERFARYAQFGIRYEESSPGSGVGDVYWNGQLVDGFADQSPTGGVFSFHSRMPGGIDVHTVYDDSGTLSGIEKNV